MLTRILLLVLVISPFSAFTQTSAPENIASQTLSELWELDSVDKKKTFRLTPYKPIYVNPVRWSSNPNEMPQSENPDYSVTEPVKLNQVETMFQLSFKTKVAQSLFGVADIWAAYTQRAFWQVYNTERSRAFRELNYEPEVIVNFPIQVNFLGFQARTIGFALNHQSNGRDLPLSRSWNRVIFHVGMEREHWKVFIRPWIRIPDEVDENPEITDFFGRAEATVTYSKKRHSIYAVMTNSLRLQDNRGSLQVNYVFPIKNNLRGQAQFFTGYGESLLDYNHRQTTLGIGVSIGDW